jgi:hypothetical protein
VYWNTQTYELIVRSLKAVGDIGRIAALVLKGRAHSISTIERDGFPYPAESR